MSKIPRDILEAFISRIVDKMNTIEDEPLDIKVRFLASAELTSVVSGLHRWFSKIALKIDLEEYGIDPSDSF